MAVIGLDIGTTGAKALIVDRDGQVLAKGYSGYALLGGGARVEQDADDWIAGGTAAIKEALCAAGQPGIEAVSLSTQGASTVAVDDAFRPLGNAWTWMDSRAGREAEELDRVLGADYFYRVTGWKLSPTLDAAKIMRMKREAPGAANYLSTLEYVNRFLTGRAVSDPTNTAIRQLFDIREGRYDDRILKAVGIAENELPEVLPAGELVGGLREEAAQRLGLPAGTPVYNGAHDQYCASIGSGAISSGDMLLSSGTTWVVMGITKRPLSTDSFIASGIHPVRGLYGAIASLACSGASLQWYKNKFLTEDFDALNEAVERKYAEPRDDLFFYPYLTGANYPVWNLDARGMFAGIGLEHDKFDLAKAVMEGVAFGLKQALCDYERNGCPVNTLRIMGGAAKSGVWKKIIAAVADVPIVQMKEPDTCALGAAMIAAVGSGMYDGYARAAEQMAHGEALSPASPEDVEYYAGKYERYCKLWTCMDRYYR